MFFCLFVCFHLFKNCVALKFQLTKVMSIFQFIDISVLKLSRINICLYDFFYIGLLSEYWIAHTEVPFHVSFISLMKKTYATDILAPVCLF